MLQTADPAVAPPPVHLDTTDLDEAREHVGRMFCRHKLTRIPDDATFRVTHSARHGDSLSFHRLDYGSTVSIEPGCLTDFYLVQVPLSGQARIDEGAASIVSTPRLASMLSPDLPIRMLWSGATPQLIIHIPADAMTRHLAAQLGRTPRQSLTFDLGLPLGQAASARMMTSLVTTLCGDDAAVRELLSHRLLAKQFEELLMTALLVEQPNNYLSYLEDPVLNVAPRHVRHAMTLCEEHAHEPLTVDDLAEACGVSARSLQEGFRKHVGSTPLAYLRDVRLERVREELVAADPGVRTVTEVALKWGFTHLSRFSGAYTARFGEAPSESLHR